jgi:hypothetical protein
MSLAAFHKKNLEPVATTLVITLLKTLMLSSGWIITFSFSFGILVWLDNNTVFILYFGWMVTIYFSFGSSGWIETLMLSFGWMISFSFSFGVNSWSEYNIDVIVCWMITLILLSGGMITLSFSVGLSSGLVITSMLSSG